MHLCHQSLSHLYLVGTFRDLHWADLMVECQPSQQALLWVLGHVQYKQGDELDELTAPFASWFSCFYLSVWLKPAIFPQWPTSPWHLRDSHSDCRWFVLYVWTNGAIQFTLHPALHYINPELISSLSEIRPWATYLQNIYLCSSGKQQPGTKF